MVAGRVVGFCGLTALAAQVRIPVPGTDVPMTLQLLAVLLAGLLLPVREALASMALYLVCGAAGLPVFAPHSLGILGPTGGFLVGFLPGVCVIGWLRGRSHPGVVRLIVASAAAAAVVLTLGTAWRAAWLGDWTVAAATSLAPFAPKAFVEVLLAAGLARQVRRWTIVRNEKGLL